MLTEYRLPGDAVFPEGITEDPDGVTFYVSSMQQGTISAATWIGRTSRCGFRQATTAGPARWA